MVSKNPPNSNSTHEDHYPEVEDIRHDLESLRNNVVELTRHIQKNGATKTLEFSRRARESISELQKKGRSEFQRVERQVKQKPAQSLAIAFTAGLLASLLLGRR